MTTGFSRQSTAVRQRLVDGAAVVETVVRAAGGDLVHRVYGARLVRILVVEVETVAPALLRLLGLFDLMITSVVGSGRDKSR